MKNTTKNLLSELEISIDQMYGMANKLMEDQPTNPDVKSLYIKARRIGSAIRVINLDVLRPDPKQKPATLKSSPFSPREFTVSLHSGFRDPDGYRVNAGSWHPTHFAYVTGPVEKGKYRIWLVVGPEPKVKMGGRVIDLSPVPDGVSIDGLIPLEKPCFARIVNKVCFVREKNGSE